MRLVIGGPTLAAVPASFAIDLAHLYAHTERWGAFAVCLRYVASTYVHTGREAVLRAALEWQASHVLWLDTDMSFPLETALRLLAHQQPIVAANCVMKVDRPIFTAMRDGRRIETGAESTGLEAVDSVGLAVMLMRMDVIDALPRPVFTHGINDDGSDVGEDVMFCRAVRRLGHAIYIDHDLSKDIGHVGFRTYRPPCAVAVPV